MTKAIDTDAPSAPDIELPPYAAQTANDLDSLLREFDEAQGNRATTPAPVNVDHSPSAAQRLAEIQHLRSSLQEFKTRYDAELRPILDEHAAEQRRAGTAQVIAGLRADNPNLEAVPDA